MEADQGAIAKGKPCRERGFYFFSCSSSKEKASDFESFGERESFLEFSWKFLIPRESIYASFYADSMQICAAVSRYMKREISRGTKK